jgi:ankyrin repeat protein
MQDQHHPEIIAAINNHQPDLLTRLLTAHSPHALNSDGNTYLHVAAVKYLMEGAPYGHDILEILLNAGVDPNVKNQKNKTAFECGNINCRDGNVHCTSLQHAVRQNLPHLFNYLMNLPGIEINKTSKDGASPVCDAAMFAKPEMLKALISAGANIYVGYDSSGKHNPLLMAMTQKTTNKSPELTLCITILLDNFAGIAIELSEDDLIDIDFTNKVLLNASYALDLIEDLSEQLVKKNPTLGSAIKTKDDLAQAVLNKKISTEQLQAIKKACLAIKAQKGKEGERINELVRFIDKNWPAHPPQPQSTPGLFSRLFGSKRIVQPSSTSPISPSAQSPSTNQKP